jgi:hypothetical protein
MALQPMYLTGLRSIGRSGYELDRGLSGLRGQKSEVSFKAKKEAGPCCTASQDETQKWASVKYYKIQLK